MGDCIFAFLFFFAGFIFGGVWVKIGIEKSGLKFKYAKGGRWEVVDDTRKPEDTSIGKCKTCAFRENDYCMNEKLREDDNETFHLTFEEKNDCLIYSYDDGGNFWVGENFGCVHWEGIDDDK